MQSAQVVTLKSGATEPLPRLTQNRQCTHLSFVHAGCPRSRGVRDLKLVKRGLVEAPELWRWSRFRAYVYQEKGPVGINQWSAPKLKTIEPTSFPM